ncbi:MAG: hypothetical protein WCV91_02815 [Candidatus Margulisiibacteriota bacterium]
MFFSMAAFGVDYDGTWFLGFNTTKPPFNKIASRIIAATEICKNDPSLPVSFIPPGMDGYDAKLLGGEGRYNIDILPVLPKERKISLLHTDGEKTIEIAEKIKNSLTKLGFEVELVKLSYKNDEVKWNKALSSKKYSLFLMGYKADLESLFTNDPDTADSDTVNLLEPLFKTKGKANFTGYSNKELDKLLQSAKKAAGEKKITALKKINQIIYNDIPAMPIFYIEKL